MNNKALLFSSVFAVLFFLIILFLTYINYNNKKKIEILSQNVQLVTRQNQLLKNTLLDYSMIFGAGSILDTLFLTNKESVLLSDLIKYKTVIARISEGSCNPCLKRELKHIKELEENGIPVILFASFSNKRSLSSLLNEYNIISEVYLLESEGHLFPFDESLRLYVFTIDKELKADNLFLPVQYEDQLSADYYQYIKTLF